jgi:hypothetical protein
VLYTFRKRLHPSTSPLHAWALYYGFKIPRFAPSASTFQANGDAPHLTSPWFRNSTGNVHD